MSNPTDTNQASEDELRAIIERYVDRAAVLANQDGTSFNNKHLLKLDMATAIETIIRTEKLKLLAEVRERVVGGRLDLRTFASDLEVKPDLETAVWVMGKDRHNELIDKQREALTELEAEL